MPRYALVSIDGTTLTSLGLTGYVNLASGSSDASYEPEYDERADGAPLFTLSTGQPRDVAAFLQYGSYIEQQSALRLIDYPRQKGERTLVVEVGDAASTVQAQAKLAIRSIHNDIGAIEVAFVQGDFAWERVTVSTDGPTSFSSAGSRIVTIGGELSVSPLIKVAWTTQRPSPNSVVGWQYRRSIVVTNNEDHTLPNFPLQLGPLDHAALVTASKSQADGDDLVVFNDRGERLRHSIVAPNTKATFIWFTVEQLKAGGSRTYDLCYGNSAATHDLTNNGFPYTYPRSPSIDLFGDSGTVSSGTSTVMTDSSGPSWDTNQLAGGSVMLFGTTTGGQYRKLLSSTSITVTVARAFTTNPVNLDPYVVLRSGFHADGGQASATTSTTLTDALQVWGANEWIGATCEIITLGGAGTIINTGTVTGNSGTILTVSSWSNGTPSPTALYRVYRRNGRWNWHVDQVQRTATNHRGRYRINRGNTKPSNVWTATDGSPGAWSPTTYNPGQASFDYNQPRFTAVDFSGDFDYFAVLNTAVARKDGARLTEEGFANGLELSCPLPILGVRHDFQIKNPNGMARAVFGSREQGGEDWEAYKEYSTTQASLTTVATAYYDLTGYGNPLHLLAALTSDDGADIEDSQTGTANLQDGAILEAYLDTRNLSVTDVATAVEDTVYDLTLTIRRGGASEDDGDDLVRIGGDDRHIFLTAAQELWLGKIGETPLAYRIYSLLYTTNVLGTDTFTASNGTALETYDTDWVEHTSSGAGSVSIDNNRVHNTNDAVTHIYYRNDWTPTSADYDVAADVVMRSDNNLSFAGVAGRIDTAANTMYTAFYNTNGNTWSLSKVVAGAVTALGTSAATLVVDQAYALRLIMRGSVIKVLVDGVVVLSVVDTAITAAGRSGVRIGQAATSTVGVHLDNWAAYQGGDQTYVRDVARHVRLYAVADNNSGTPTRYVSTDPLPLLGDTSTYYVSDADGNMGTLTVQLDYHERYL